MNKRVNLFNSTISASLERLLRAKKEDEYVNFDDVCRSCLSSKNELTNIHQISFGELNIAEVFEQYIAIKVEDQDDLPQNLCTMCLYELCRVYLFVNNCREADAKLKELVLKVQNGDEEVYHESVVATENREVTGWDLQNNTNDVLQMGPIKVTEPGPPFICNNCSESFDTLSEIKMHRTLHKHYIMRQYLCRVCNPSKVYSYRQWRNHMRVHTGEKPYECPICGKRFSVPCNRERHILVHTGEKPYKCDQCDHAFGQSTNLKQHKLRAHLGQKLEREKGSFECKHCQKIFSTRGSLAHHTVIHYDKKFLCNECGKSFHYKIQFNMHMDSHRGIRRYKCNICDKAFARPISLGLHKRTHTGHKPYECKYCDKRFSQKAHLVSHIRTHTGERPYSCPYCEKTFALNGNLTVHIRKHTGENPYVCDICSKGFPDSSSMKNHRKKHVVNLYDMLT